MGWRLVFWCGMKCAPDPHYHHRFPAEIISHTMWLYYCTFCFRDVELMPLERAASHSCTSSMIRSSH